MPTVRERCSCGATFETTSRWDSEVASRAKEFREAHQRCRERELRVGPFPLASGIGEWRTDPTDPNPGFRPPPIVGSRDDGSPVRQGRPHPGDSAARRDGLIS